MRHILGSGVLIVIRTKYISTKSSAFSPTYNATPDSAPDATDATDAIFVLNGTFGGHGCCGPI